MQNEHLQLTPAEMRTLGYQVIDLLVDHLTQLPHKRIAHRGERQQLAQALQEPLPEQGITGADLLTQITQVVMSNITHVDHQRFFAFVPGPSNFVSVLGDTLAAGFNVFAGTWLEGSGPAQVELVTIDWLRTACGLPPAAGGLFVSGGSVANLTALAVARHLRLHDQTAGAVIYCSDQTHSAVERALWLLGFQPDQLRKLPSTPTFQLDPARLHQAVATDRAAGLRPFCVVANAGTTNTGAIDPLPLLVDFCHNEGLWLHVDGAYGVPAVFCEQGKRLLQGLDGVHSLTLDPHKWLFQPYEMGCVLVRDAAWLKQTFHILPAYLADAAAHDAEVNFSDMGIQLTRSFRALKLWMSLKYFGRAAFAAAIERCFELARIAEAAVRVLNDWEVVTPAQLAIVTFRYAPVGLPLDDCNQLNWKLVELLLADGSAMVSSTVLQGKTVLRMCTLNPRTTDEEIQHTLIQLDHMAQLL